MKTTTALKVSSKMRKSIERLEKKHGELVKSYGTESDSRNVHNEKFYCYCELTDKYFKNFKMTVCYDGTIHNC